MGGHLLSVFSCIADSGDNKTDSLGSLLADWRQEEASSDRAEFEFLEPVYSLRVAAVRLLAASERHPDARAALQDILLKTAKSARVAGYYQVGWLADVCVLYMLHESYLQNKNLIPNSVIAELVPRTKWL